MVSYHDSQFKLYVEGDGSDSLRVIRFYSKHYAISRPYRFKIVVLAGKALDPKVLLNKSTCLMVDETFISGYLERIIFKYFDDKGFYYHLSFVCPLYRLRHRYRSQIFLGNTCSEILTFLLRSNGWTRDQIIFSFQKPLKKIGVMTQYRETDLQFFQRLITTFGLSYRFEQVKYAFRLKITDHIARLVYHREVRRLDVHLPEGFVDHSSSMGVFKKKQFLLGGVSRVKNRHEALPALRFHGSHIGMTQTPTFGEECYYGLGLSGIEASSKAKIDQARVDSKRQEWVVVTNRSDLALGEIVELNSPVDPFWQRTFRVVAFDYVGDERASIDKDNRDSQRFLNKVTLISVDSSYVLSGKEEMRRAIGFQLGFVDSSNRRLDEAGRYVVRHLFTEMSKNRLQCIVCAQEFTGFGRGLHFPLQDHAEVLLVYRNDDSNRPVIVGALSNSNGLNPVCAENSTEYKIRTALGHEWLWEDTASFRKMILRTADRNQSFHFEERTGRIILSNKIGDICIQTRKKSLFRADCEHIQCISGTQSIMVGKKYVLRTRQGSIIWQVADQLKMRAGYSFSIGVDQIFKVNCFGYLRLDADKCLVMKARGGMSCLGEESVDIKARDILSVQGESVMITTGASRLSLVGGVAMFEGTCIQVQVN